MMDNVSICPLATQEPKVHAFSREGKISTGEKLTFKCKCGEVRLYVCVEAYKMHQEK